MKPDETRYHETSSRFAETCGILSFSRGTMTVEGAGKSVLVNGRMEEKVISVSNRYLGNRYIGNRLEMELLIDILIFKNDIFQAFKGFIYK